MPTQSTPRQSRYPNPPLQLALLLCCSLPLPAADQQTHRAPPPPVYAKIILPLPAPDGVEQPPVESWIAAGLTKRGVTQYRAVTNWVRLAEDGERMTHVWDATLDDKLWGCPVGGRVHRNLEDGRIHADISGWAPAAMQVYGATLSPEVGTRKIARLEGNAAYIAIMVAPPNLPDPTP